VQEIRSATGSRTRIVPVPGPVVVALSSALGLMLRDVLLTRDEYRSMAEGLASTDGAATGATLVSKWLAEHGDRLGLEYANELRRHFD